MNDSSVEWDTPQKKKKEIHHLQKYQKQFKGAIRQRLRATIYKLYYLYNVIKLRKNRRISLNNQLLYNVWKDVPGRTS